MSSYTLSPDECACERKNRFQECVPAVVRRIVAAPLLCAWMFCLPLVGFGASPETSSSPVSIVDDAGRTVSLSYPAQRIIPLYAALGETLAAMGLADAVVGRTVSDDTLPQELPVVGTHMRPNPELVAALRPDLVILLEGRQEAGLTADTVAGMGIAVARFRISSFADLFSCIQRLGTLTGEQDKAEELIRSMRERLAAVAEKTARLDHKPSVFFEIRYPNLLGAGGGSMLTDIIRVAGGVNCLADHDERMVRLSEESLVLMNPDVYLIQEGAMNKQPIALEQRPHFRGLAATRKGFVFTVRESRFSRPGPQSILAVEELADILLQYPAGVLP